MKSLEIVLDFVERYNKNDSEKEVAQAAIDLKRIYCELVKALKSSVEALRYDEVIINIIKLEEVIKSGESE
jgi:hypothetical protein